MYFRCLDYTMSQHSDNDDHKRSVAQTKSRTTKWLQSVFFIYLYVTLCHICCIIRRLKHMINNKQGLINGIGWWQNNYVLYFYTRTHYKYLFRTTAYNNIVYTGTLNATIKSTPVMGIWRRTPKWLSSPLKCLVTRSSGGRSSYRWRIGSHLNINS